MSDRDVFGQIVETTSRLNVVLFTVTLEGFTRGGLPASTRPDPSRAHNQHGLLELDQLDRAIVGWRTAHSALLRSALMAMLEVEQLQRRVIPPVEEQEPERYGLWFEEMSKQAEMDHKAPSVRCENCNRWVLQFANDRIKAGRCNACFMWRRRHGGDERPEAQWAEATA